MDENNRCNFITGSELSSIIDAQTNGPSGKFHRRDFVEPMLRFCLDGNYTSRIGILYGLRSTGKTVGMLQVAEELTGGGHKVAYVRFNYEKTGMRDANSEIVRLAKKGYTHFLIDEAPYLSGFINESAEWADTFVPQYRIKMVISGTDSFELWLAMNRALYHRFVRFSANRNSYPEYKRVWGKGYDEYKTMGGVFLASEEIGASEPENGSQVRDDSDSVMEHFIEAAVVENLIHTLEHCNENSGYKNYYYDWLYAIDKLVIFKGVISILESTVAAPVRKNFIQEADRKNIPDLGVAISNWPDPEKRDIKERVAESLSVYRDFKKIEDPAGTVEALIAFLVKIGCLAESITGMSDLGNQQKTLYFAHNALMNYALRETVRGILSMPGIDRPVFVNGLNQAAEGCLNENIVYVHLMMSASKNETVFRYRDPETREIDAVTVDREAKTLRLIEVKSKSKIDGNRVFANEAKHLFDGEVLKNIGIDDTFAVTRVLAYRGETGYVIRPKDVLLLVNIEDALAHYKELGHFLDKLSASAEKERLKRHPKPLLEQLHEYTEKSKRDCEPPQKAKDRGGQGIGER
jgi:predicted AAA+ superfamily ATPase